MRRRAPFLVALAASLALLAYHVAPLWREVRSWGGTRDWLYFFFMAEVDRITVLRYHQFPLWNPYYCGGAVHLANPQTFFLSPTFLFILAFGTPIGIRLTITASIVLAFDGVRRLARRWTHDDVASMLAGCLYAVSGTMAQHLGGGHVGWLGFGVLPYVLLCFDRSLEDGMRFIVYGALGLAWIFGHFGVYPYPYSAMALGVYALSTGISRRRVFASIVASSAMVLLSLGFSAVRLLPILEFIRVHPRPVFDDDTLNLKELWTIYTDPAHPRAFPGHQWVWPEYGNYLTVAGVALFALGTIVLARRARRYLPLLLPVFFFLLLQLGNTPSMPWWILKQLDLPLVRNLRVPSRFTILVGLFASLVISALVARANEIGLRALKRRRPFDMLYALAILALGVGAVWRASDVNRGQWLQTFGTRPPADEPSAQFRQETGDAARMYAYPRANRGSIACFEESPLDISKDLRGGLPADEYLEDPNAGRVTRVSWSPNRIELDVFVERPATVIVNQNFENGWQARGGVVTSYRGLLAATVPAGTSRLVFSYSPRSFWFGALLTLVTSVLAIPYALRDSWRLFRRRRESLGENDHAKSPQSGG